jgi:S1-C subfamily serine protease
LGVRIQNVDAEIAKEMKLDKVEGVLVADVTDNGAAQKAGIKKEDVIIRVGGEKTKTAAELQEKISQYRPGDNVKIIVIRDNEKKQFTVNLRNKHGDTDVVRGNLTILGADFEEINNNVKAKLGIKNGIAITGLSKGKLKEAGIEKGFIITSVNKKPVYDVSDFKREIGNAEGGILVEGIYPNGEHAYYVFGTGR